MGHAWRTKAGPFTRRDAGASSHRTPSRGDKLRDWRSARRGSARRVWILHRLDAA